MTTQVTAEITEGIMPVTTPSDFSTALAALRRKAIPRAWGPAYLATQEALSDAAAPGIEAVLLRDGQWTAPLPVGDALLTCLNTEMRLRLVTAP
ncbi:hypothetical protein GCM10010441_77440 [Kitasatospora paracochleata]|uniref:Uncharacterized protein n=1 Tax=Kitasatospora paracochleata TaxID=58354 RepID=A0ABT1J988_9ACTN|nr:hypothetical protein [Kitasatospora paracochleata]MCP2314018.1 hypothetical protein [Kitasatospora paracochleata]